MFIILYRIINTNQLLETPEPMNLGLSDTSVMTDQPAINVDCIIQSQLQTRGFSLVSTPRKDINADVNSSEVELFDISGPNISAITNIALPIEYEDSRGNDIIITKYLYIIITTLGYYLYLRLYILV